MEEQEGYWQPSSIIGLCQSKFRLEIYQNNPIILGPKCPKVAIMSNESMNTTIDFGDVIYVYFTHVHDDISIIYMIDSNSKNCCYYSYSYDILALD